MSRDLQTLGISPAQSYRRFLTQSWVLVFVLWVFILAKESNFLFLQENKLFRKMAIFGSFRGAEVLCSFLMAHLAKV